MRRKGGKWAPTKWLIVPLNDPMETESWSISCRIPGHPLPPPPIPTHTHNPADAAAVVWMRRMHVTYRNTGRMSAPPSGVYKSAASWSARFQCKHWALGEHLSQPQSQISFCNDFYQSSARVFKKGESFCDFSRSLGDLTPIEGADMSL